jgi:hypothetical protein
MQDFYDSEDQIGIKRSPFVENPDRLIKQFPDETAVFFENCLLYVDSIEHLRDCVDCYFVMCRQKDRKPIPDHFCFDLLQYITRARYNLGELVEDFTIFERNIDAKVSHFLNFDPKDSLEN